MRGDVLKYFDVTFYSDTLQAFHTTTLHILCDETAETKFLSKGLRYINDGSETKIQADLNLEATTLFQLFLVARCLLNSSSSCSSVSLCPEIAYQVTVAIPSVAVRTHLNHARLRRITLDLSMISRLIGGESTHPNIAPMPLGLHPKIWGNGPSGKPLRSFGS